MATNPAIVPIYREGKSGQHRVMYRWRAGCTAINAVQQIVPQKITVPA